MANLNGKTLFITGSSRGIGKALALRAAADGANIVIAAKTVEPHPRLEGTIFTAAAEVEAAGGKALPLQVDIRAENQITAAVATAVAEYGGIDILINNASAISLTGTLQTPLKRYDLMQQVNARGAFAMSQACLPHLLRAGNPHILTMAPPLNLNPRWFRDHCAYTLAKYGMSMCMLGLAEEFRPQGIGINCLWPRTVIQTAALEMLNGVVQPENCRTAAIVADAAHAILTRNSRECTGNFFIDEEVLRDTGITDFANYAVNPAAELLPDLFLD